MIIQLQEGGVTVAEADDCGRLHVTAAPDLDVDAILRATGLGRVSATGEASLSVSGLRERAASASTVVDWDSAWEAMIDYAATKGWVTPDRHEVMAHIEPA
jgi:hypothetical protein